MTKITTSLNEVKKYSSERDFKKLLSSKNKTEADDELFPLSDILSIDGQKNCLWVIQCMDKKYNQLKIKYAV